MLEIPTLFTKIEMSLSYYNYLLILLKKLGSDWHNVKSAYIILVNILLSWFYFLIFSNALSIFCLFLATIHILNPNSANS